MTSKLETLKARMVGEDSVWLPIKDLEELVEVVDVLRSIEISCAEEGYWMRVNGGRFKGAIYMGYRDSIMLKAFLEFAIRRDKALAPLDREVE